MEPIVVFSAGVVAYYAYRAVQDALVDLRRDRTANLLEKAARQASKPAEPGNPAVTPVVSLEKLSKILAVRDKKFPLNGAGNPPGGCREQLERFFTPTASRFRTGPGIAHAFDPKR